MISKPTIAGDSVAELGPLLSHLGADFGTLLKDVGLTAADLSGTEKRISLNAIVELLEQAAIVLRSDGLGMRIARDFPAGRTGILGYAVLSAPTLRDAFKDVHRYFRLITPHQHAEFIETDTQAELVWKFSERLAEPNTQYKTMTMAMMVRRVRLAAGPNWTPDQMILEVRRPNDLTDYISIFGHHLQFGAARSRMICSKDILDLKMPGSDARLHKLMLELGDYRLSELEAESDIVDRTQDQIIAMLTQGQVTLEMVARELGTSPRSLQRRLKDEGTTFHTVFEKTRRLLARHYLRMRQYTLAEVAFLLGFSEQSAFTRACRRWFDATPYEMRGRLRSD
ncbi:MAG: AraC family transcriptional regulator [Pseudomonadota bacterium]